MRSIFPLCLVLALTAGAAAQKPPSQPATVDAREAADLAQGWTMLAQGPAAQASTRAAQILEKYPRSASALALAVEAQIARGGSAAGLDQYERWLGQRTMEEPGVLRRVALGVLREAAFQQADATTRAEALEALAAEQDPLSAAALAGVDPSDPGQMRLRAAMGDSAAVKALITQLQARQNELAAIEALGKSGSRAAVEPIVQQLSNPRPEVRGAAAEALGRLSGASAVPRLKTMLSDQSGYVRVRAAAALYRLDDVSGLPLLQELLTSDAAQSRLIAVQAMATRPDAAWQAAARSLTDAQEPEVRVSAARLIAPYDPELAARVLDQLSRDRNPVIRDLAARAQPEVAGDLTALRHLMHNPDVATRVRAADRVLRLTR